MMTRVAGSMGGDTDEHAPQRAREGKRREHAEHQANDAQAHALSPDGSSYHMRTRFHFQNVPELVKLFRTVADVRMAEPYDEAAE